MEHTNIPTKSIKHILVIIFFISIYSLSLLSKGTVGIGVRPTLHYVLLIVELSNLYFI